MQSTDPVDKPFSATSWLLESKKRKREVIVIFCLASLFLFLTWFEVKLFGISQQLPFVHSIFFFGLVNFNIVILLLLLFLIFRNVVKVFVERRGRIYGSSLKAKLIAAFVAFSTIPTLLLFITSVFYINSSFDKWFSVKMSGVLKSSIEVTSAYYFNAKKRNYHFAHQIAQQIKGMPERKSIKSRIEKLRALYALDSVEFYPSLVGSRELVLSDDETIPMIPPVSLEFLSKGIKNKVDASLIHQFGEGNLVRVIVPISEKSSKGAIVVSSFVPLSLTAKMNDISSAFEEFKDINPIEYPIKSIYLIVLVLMTLVILLAGSWFGFYLAKQLSIPLVQLGKATKRVATGDYTPVLIKTGSEEIHSLVDNFNQMTSNLAKSETEVRSANESLKQTLSDLDKHNRYIEVVLKNVSAGVISVDQKGKITTINRRAGNLLKIEPIRFVGRPVRELLTLEYFRTFSQLLKTMTEHKIESIQKEVKVNVQGESIPFQLTLSILKDDRGEDIGKILVFDDMTPILSAQRSAAWTEVARRIAHEIKNPLTPIKLSAERLLRKFGDQITDPAFRECTTMIVRQTEDLKNLVNEFSQFARLPQARPVVADINETISQAVALFKNAQSADVIVSDLDPHTPHFKFDPDQIKRAVVNLVDNALAAVQNEKVKKVEVTSRFDADLKILKVTVSDSGVGIPPVMRTRIFEPYYSTKEGGTGLGLAIVKRIIEDHSGFVRALANNPTGTKMLIELPVSDLNSWMPSERSST
jgi:two-component system nitrogen regulation sensor histidine kinase NtrY